MKADCAKCGTSYNKHVGLDHAYVMPNVCVICGVKSMNHSYMLHDFVGSATTARYHDNISDCKHAQNGGTENTDHRVVPR